MYVDLSECGSGGYLDRVAFTVEKSLQLLTDLSPDDVLVFCSGEQVLSREFLVFLRVYHNYPMPVVAGLRSFVHGFYWQLDPPVSSEKIVSDFNSLNLNEDSVSVKKPNLNRRKSLRKKLDSYTTKETFSSKKSIFNNLGKSVSSHPHIMAVSLNILNNVFNYKTKQLFNTSNNKLAEFSEFFSGQDQALFYWTFPNAGWGCHLCAREPIDSVRKIARRNKVDENVRETVSDNDKSMHVNISENDKNVHVNVSEDDKNVHINVSEDHKNVHINVSEDDKNVHLNVSKDGKSVHVSDDHSIFTGANTVNLVFNMFNNRSQVPIAFYNATVSRWKRLGIDEFNNKAKPFDVRSNVEDLPSNVFNKDIFHFLLQP